MSEKKARVQSGIVIASTNGKRLGRRVLIKPRPFNYMLGLIGSESRGALQSITLQIMKIVQFENGKYAVRTFKFLWWSEYLDLKNNRFQWSKNNKYFKDCVADSLEDLKEFRRTGFEKEKVIEKLQLQRKVTKEIYIYINILYK